MKNKKVLAILVVVIVAVLAFVAYNVFFKAKGDEAAAEVQKVTYFVPGEYFVCNIKDSEALSKVAVALAYTGKDETDFLTTSQPAIRDTIVRVLRSHTEEELRDPSTIDVLSKEMTDAINKVLGVDYVVDVYISDYVVQ